MFNLFDYLRRRTRDSMLAGAGDFVEIVADPDPAKDSKAVEDLRKRLASQPVVAIEEVKRRGNAQKGTS